jgi:aryl-alcohol dehydrogenase-like predicted oxidoreductase
MQPREQYDRDAAINAMSDFGDFPRYDRFRVQPTSINEDLLRVPGVDQDIKDTLQNCYSQLYCELTHDELTDLAHDNDVSIMNTSALLFIFLALRWNGNDLRETEQQFFTWLRRTKQIENVSAVLRIVYAVSGKVESRGAWKEREDFD